MVNMLGRKGPLLKKYTSEIDLFLQAFDEKPEASSVSRRAEEVKYARIHALRDKESEKSKILSGEDFSDER
jgi:hypothetical protein